MNLLNGLNAPMEDRPLEVKYKPVSLRRLLKDMKSKGSLSVDLAFYSLVYGDSDMASEVEKLVDAIDEDLTQLFLHSMLAARSPRDAELMVPVLMAANTMDALSEAASDMVTVLLKGYKIPKAVKAALNATEEAYLRIEIPRPMYVRDLRDGAIDIIAVRREKKYIIDPSDYFKLMSGDIVIVRGDREDIMELAKKFNIRIPSEAPTDPKLSEIASRLANLKNLADVAMDMSIYSLVYEDKNAAMEVLEVERFIDEESARLELKLLETVDDPQEAYSASVIITSLERISDAATYIAKIAASGTPVHPILREVEMESDEKIIIVQVDKDGYKVKDVEDLLEGTVIAACIEGFWIPLPKPNMELQRGVKVVVKTYSEIDEEELKNKGLLILKPGQE